jgi:hypothetical protein
LPSKGRRLNHETQAPHDRLGSEEDAAASHLHATRC